MIKAILVLYYFALPSMMNSFTSSFAIQCKKCRPRLGTTRASSFITQLSNDNTGANNGVKENTDVNAENTEPVHIAEGLCAVYKPLDWTSQDVVAYIRGMLERDARDRGVTLAKRRSRKSKKKVKVGHGGTLDPLADGVLVLGIGAGTKMLSNYLSGAKAYEATGKFGFETNTLDLDKAGNVTKTEPFDHITHESVQSCLPKFRGKIMQTPPIFSAIRKNGKRLYEQAREGKTEDDVEIEAREVEIHSLEYVQNDGEGLPSFGLSISCGGGTYVRSLIRDIGREVDSVATMTSLTRTKQGPFVLDDAIPREEWSADSIYAAVERNNLEVFPIQEEETSES
jgi:tRNA pseudouridine55 synthase